jgi:hypothetical protein
MQRLQRSKFPSLLLASLVSATVAQTASAGCVCQCVNGHVEAICQSAIDLKPICSPTLCPIVPPSLKPIESPTLPPLGTSQCHNQQVWNPTLGRYEWVRLCN